MDGHVPKREMEIIKDMLMIVLKKKEAEEFIYAVDPKQYPAYYEVIKHPMNLMAVHNRLHPYLNIEKPLSDMRLVWDNCKKFNDANSDIYKTADILSSYFEEFVKSSLGIEYTKGYELSEQFNKPNPGPQLEVMRSILNSILKKPESRDFMYTVDHKQYPLYYDIIRNPMDLKTIQNRLYPYKEVNDVLNDIRLVWENCRRFNQPGSEIYLDATHMANFFEDLVYGRLGRAYQVKPAQSIQAEVLPLVSHKIPNSSYWNSAPTLSLINVGKLAGKPLSTFQNRIPQGSKLGKYHIKPLPANSAVALSQMSDVDIHNKKRPRSPDQLIPVATFSKSHPYSSSEVDKFESVDEEDPLLLLPHPEKRGKGRPRKYPVSQDIILQSNKLAHRFVDSNGSGKTSKDGHETKFQTRAARKQIKEEEANKNLTTVSINSIDKQQFRFCHQNLTNAL